MKIQRVGLAASAAMMVLLAASVASAVDWLADVPLETITASGNLIVVARVVRFEPPVQMNFAVPAFVGEDVRVEGRFRRYQLKITRVIKTDVDGKDKPARGGQIKVLALAPPAQDPGGLMPLGASWVNLHVNQSYVLVLHRLPGKSERYLPSYRKNHAPATARTIAEYVKALNVDGWGWGKTVNGLQATFLVNRTTVPLQKAFVKVPGGPRHGILCITANIQAAMALRNITDKPIQLGLNPDDEFLNIQCISPDGKAVPFDPYNQLVSQDPGGLDNEHTVSIAPGEVVFLTPWGRTDSSIRYELPLTNGKWTLKASYKASRKDGGKVWTGTVESNAVRIEVGKRPRRHQPQPGKPGPVGPKPVG